MDGKGMAGLFLRGNRRIGRYERAGRGGREQYGYVYMGG